MRAFFSPSAPRNDRFPGTRHQEQTALNGRILITGAAGQLGQELLRQLGTQAVGLSHAECDIADPSAVEQQVAAYRPEIVINTAAWNQVDRAEQQPDSAFRVNEVGPRNLAVACRRMGARLVQISSDYVFGGERDRRTPYTESDLPSPVNRYGESKWAGERAVLETDPQALVVRTCGLYGWPPATGKRSFAETILQRAEECHELRVVADQCCTPTFIPHLVIGLQQLLNRQATGIVHLTNRGAASWFEFAQKLLEEVHWNGKLHPIRSEELSLAAKRPAYSVLSTARFEQWTGSSLPDWQQAVQEYLQRRRA